MSKKLIISALLTMFALFSFVLYWRFISLPAQKVPNTVIFFIVKGQSVGVIAKNLKAADLIKSDLYFKYYVWRTGKQADFKAGEYVLNPALSAEEIVGILAGGQVISREKEIKILEGWSISDISEYLADNDIGGFSDLAHKKINDWNFQFAKPQVLKNAPADADFEGFLFPDTYRVYKGAKAENVINKMIKNFNDKLSPDLCKEINAQNKTVFDIIIMASLIEKEVSKDEDRAIVSGILNKRLKLDMPLGVDSTINYITSKNNPQSDAKDLAIDSPYNTYKYRGLPPGPICNPSLSSIMAAIRPQSSHYLYYLNRQDTGETIFSKTYEEHLANKRKYLKN